VADWQPLPAGHCGSPITRHEFSRIRSHNHSLAPQNLVTMLQAADRPHRQLFPESKDEPEVDVELSMGIKHLPCEVKYRTKTKSSDHDGLRSFLSRKHDEADFGVLITQEHSGEIEDRILAVPAKTLMLLL
jgi:predicted AAA+ superfamily ATPase